MKLQTVEDLKNVVANNNIRAIEVNRFALSSEITCSEKDDGVELSFAKAWCKENEDRLNETLVYIIENHKDKRFVINSGSLINDEIIHAIANNKNIEEVTFGGFLDAYTLTESHYLALKDTVKKIESDKVEDKLKLNFDKVIDHNRKKFLVSSYSYDGLQKDKVYFTLPVKDEEMGYLKFLGDKTVVELMGNTNAIDIIDAIRSAGKNNLILYNPLGELSNQFTGDLVKRNINCENVFILMPIRSTMSSEKSETLRYPLKKIAEGEKILNSIIKPAKNLSPFEKYIYAYDVTKKFKEYKEIKRTSKTRELLKSRRVYDILNNNYMVCVGYSNLLGNLLDKLGIENTEFSVKVGLQPYKAEAQLEAKYGDQWKEIDRDEKDRLIDEQKNYIPDSWLGHARRLVHIVDDKYGINGLYFSDPTWDNNLIHNSYNHLLLTSEEVLNSKANYKFSENANELFHCSSVKEFNEKLNVILNRTIPEALNHKAEFQRLLKEESVAINKLDLEFYNNLYQKYEFLRTENYKVKDLDNIPKVLENYLEDVGNYISKSKKNAAAEKPGLADFKDLHEALKIERYCYESPNKRFQEIAQELSGIVKKLDNQFYNELYQKYEFLRTNDFNTVEFRNIPKEQTDYLYDVANYIAERINHTVDGKTILSAVKSVYDTVYVGGMSKEELEGIRAYNSKLAERKFATDKFSECASIMHDDSSAPSRDGI